MSDSLYSPNTLCALSEKPYIDGLLALTPTMENWNKRSGNYSLEEWLLQYRITLSELNLGRYMYENSYPVPYRVARIKELCLEYGSRDGPFPEEPLDDIYLSGDGQYVNVFSSVIVTTEHINENLLSDLRAGDAVIMYYKPKMNGDYAWTLKWSVESAIYVTRTTIRFDPKIIIGMSYEFIDGSYYPHVGSHMPCFSAIEELEQFYGLQDEIIVGIMCCNMLNEFKLKKSNTFELKNFHGDLLDSDGNGYGTITGAEGIYECGYSDNTQTVLVPIRKRTDKTHPQSEQVIGEILGSPTIEDFRKYRALTAPKNTMAGICVGDAEVLQDDASDWVVSDMFEIGRLSKMQTYETLLMRLSRYHFRKYGNRLVRTPGLQWGNTEAFVSYSTMKIDFSICGGIGPSPGSIAYLPALVPGIELVEMIVTHISPEFEKISFEQKEAIEMKEYAEQSTLLSRMLNFVYTGKVSIKAGSEEGKYFDLLKAYFGIEYGFTLDRWCRKMINVIEWRRRFALNLERVILDYSVSREYARVAYNYGQVVCSRAILSPIIPLKFVRIPRKHQYYDIRLVNRPKINST
jgi:hypothetical protein